MGTVCAAPCEQGDTLSRFGGDEFVVLLEGITSPDEASEVANDVLEAFRDPITLRGGREVVATLSIGIALSGDGTSRDDLLHHADTAMYRAKQRGRGGQFALFDVERMGVRPVSRLDLDTALHHVVDRGEVEIHYQPLVSLTDRRIVGAEALVRWNHPDHGILLPAHFIKAAEDNGTIVPIGAMVLEQACRQAQTWRQEFGVTLQMGVNLSGRQFQRADLVDQVDGVLRATGLDPGQLCLEITESLAMDDVDLTSHVVTKLHSLGVRVAIDDFGTGHSSLASLARFPDRRGEDRPQLRPRRRPRRRAVGHRVHGGGAVDGDGFDHRGRGCGDPGPGRGAHEHRVRRRAGLLLRTSSVSGRVQHDVDHERRFLRSAGPARGARGTGGLSRPGTEPSGSRAVREPSRPVRLLIDAAHARA